MKKQTRDESDSRFRRIVGTGSTTLVAVILFGSASAKLGHVPSVVSQLAAVGITNSRLIFVAVLELLSASLFLIPATRSAGLLLVSSFLGGAIATHLQHAQSIAPPSIILALTWFGVWLRHPEMLWSWKVEAAARESGELK